MDIHIWDKIRKSFYRHWISRVSKLTQITLKTTKLKKKTVGKNAVKGTPKNLKISAPKKVKKSYQKIFRSKGNKKVTVK